MIIHHTADQPVKGAQSPAAAREPQGWAHDGEGVPQARLLSLRGEEES